MKTYSLNRYPLKKSPVVTGKGLLAGWTTFVLVLSILCAGAHPAWAEMNLEQTISDGAQSSTIAFDGFAIVTGTFEAQSFFPPGKVADYWGFQYLRDNTSNGNGHNTSFLTNCAFNVLYTLTDDQFEMLKTLAASQVDQINLYAYKRFPLMKAFRRQLEGDIPTGSTGLSLSAVKAASADLYALDGQISFDRAVVYATIFQGLTDTQVAYFTTMKEGGFDSWTVTSEMDAAVRERMKGVSHDVSVALMTYAGDLFSWYAGSLDADVYFCPERQGTYFGSFYVKDAPAIGHEGYKIDEQLTASAGQKFLEELATTGLDSLVTGLVEEQRDSLYAGTVNIVSIRTEISTLLRSLITASSLTDAFKAKVLDQVLEKSRTYGELDGQVVYSYAMAFSDVYGAMTDTQKADLADLRKTIMSGVYNGVAFDYSLCTTPFLYSAVIEDTSVLDPYISDTDYLFGEGSAGITLSPQTATVKTGEKQKFTATVSGSSNKGVVWQVNGLKGGSRTVGTISTSGLYTAPSSVPSSSSVKVTAVAKADSSVTASASVTIISAKPSASFTFSPASPTPGQKVSFEDGSTGSPTSWSWKFGDGATSTSRNPTHVYKKAGSYTVTLKAANKNGFSSSTRVVTVVAAQKPSASFTFSPSSPTTTQAVSFTDTSTGSPTSWSWKFGDGKTSTSQDPKHTYSRTGRFTVTLVATNAEGSSTVKHTLTVASGSTSFSVTSDAGPEGGTLPHEYTCDGAGSSPALSWSSAPEGTKEFALMMTTIPVDGNTKWNWVLFSIPGTTTGLAKNTTGVGLAGQGSNGPTQGYQPPCSQGPGAKLYTFTLYALSASPSLPADPSQVTGAVLTQAISSITLGTASLNLSHTRAL